MNIIHNLPPPPPSFVHPHIFCVGAICLPTNQFRSINTENCFSYFHTHTHFPMLFLKMFIFIFPYEAYVREENWTREMGNYSGVFLKVFWGGGKHLKDREWVETRKFPAMQLCFFHPFQGNSSERVFPHFMLFIYAFFCCYFNLICTPLSHCNRVRERERVSEFPSLFMLSKISMLPGCINHIKTLASFDT